MIGAEAADTQSGTTLRVARTVYSAIERYISAATGDLTKHIVQFCTLVAMRVEAIGHYGGLNFFHIVVFEWCTSVAIVSSFFAVLLIIAATSGSTRLAVHGSQGAVSQALTGIQATLIELKAELSNPADLFTVLSLVAFFTLNPYNLAGTLSSVLSVLTVLFFAKTYHHLKLAVNTRFRAADQPVPVVNANGVPV